MKGALRIAFPVGILVPFLAWSQISNIVVTNAASFQAGMPAKGSIGTIFCTGLKVTGVVSSTSLPLTTSLAGVSVTVDGVPAPLFAVADLGGYQQINFQVPVQILYGTLVVSQNGAQGSVWVTTNPDHAGDFFRLGSTPFGVFQHADYSLVTPDNPAKAGETIIGYATGLPTATPEVPTGQSAPMSPLSYVPQYYSSSNIERIGLVIDSTFWLFDEVPASGNNTTGLLPIPFMGLAPGTVGVFQINFMLPQGVASGDVSVTLVEEYCALPPKYPRSCLDPAQSGFTYSQPVLVPVR